MTRRKVEEQEKLTEKIGLRVSVEFYKKMEQWQTQSNCRSVSELARRILYKEEIIWYHKDSRLDETARELALIRKELNAIGNNINQAVRIMNTTPLSDLITSEDKNISDSNKQLLRHLSRVAEMIEAVSKQWLQK